MYIEEFVREAVEDMEDGEKVCGKCLKASRSADGQARIARSQ